MKALDLCIIIFLIMVIFGSWNTKTYYVEEAGVLSYQIANSFIKGWKHED